MSKVKGAPLRSACPRRASSTLARWKPSIGTTTPSAKTSVSRAASVDLPAPGGPAIPTIIRRPALRRAVMVSTSVENTLTSDIGLRYPGLADLYRERIVVQEY